MSLFNELKRRSVIRVAASYAVIGWLVLQIADVVLEPMGAPDWSMRALIVLVIIGFPVALILAWTFELTPQGVERDRRAPDEERPIVHGVRRYADFLVIGVLLVVIAVLLSRKGPIDFEVTDTPVVGVLPFNEIGVEDNVFGLGLADTLIHKLGQVGQLVVLTSSSTFEFVGTSLDLAEVGSKLGASILLEGTVQRGVGTLRVNARLVEARTGQQLWSDSYQRAADDLFAVQDQIAAEVSRALSVVLSTEQKQRIAAPVTSSLTAFDAYSLGLVNFARRSNEGVTKAMEYLREAIRLDPEFTLAHARLAQVLYAAPYYAREEVKWEDVREEALVAAETAFRLEPKLGDSVLAKYYFWKAESTWNESSKVADAELASLARTATELSPSSSRAFRELARYVEEPAEQIAILDRAARLDPRSGLIPYDIAIIYAEQGEFREAEKWLLRSGATAEPYFFIGYNNIQVMWSYYAGRYDEATRWSGALAEKFGGRFWISHFRRLVDFGAYAEAESIFSQQSQLTPDDSELRSYWNLMEPLLTWQQGDLTTAAEQWVQVETQILSKVPGWPDMTRISGMAWGPALAAKFEIEGGRPEKALERYRVAYSDPRQYQTQLRAGIYLHPMIMQGTLLKLLGRVEEGRDLIHAYLDRTSGFPINMRHGSGFNRFVSYALLGRVEDARSEMRKALELSFTVNSSMLSVPDFDADYRAVMADAEVSALYQELLDLKQAQLESYRANAELPLARIPYLVPAVSDP